MTLASARRRLEALVARGHLPGAQLAVRHRGAPVLSLALGVARGFRPAEGTAVIPVREDTAFAVFSAGKPVVGTAIALCEERGLLDADRPVALYFPEFARHGKADIRLADVLTHRSGVLLAGLSDAPGRWRDLAHVAEALAEAKPVHPRGTLAYAPLEYGWILGEVLRRVTGRTLGDFVASEIAAPLGIPALAFGARGRPRESLAKPYWLGGSTFVAGRDVSRGFEAVNDSDDFLEAELPGAGLVTDAASLAVFYDFWLSGGLAPGGRRLLAKQRVERQLRRRARGFDRSNRSPLAVARGFLLGTLGPSAYGWWGTQRCYGHAGAFSTLAFADPDRHLSVALVSNGNRGRRELLLELMPVVDAVRRSFPRERDRSR